MGIGSKQEGFIEVEAGPDKVCEKGNDNFLWTYALFLPALNRDIFEGNTSKCEQHLEMRPAGTGDYWFRQVERSNYRR